VYRVLYSTPIREALRITSINTEITARIQAMVESRFCQLALASFKEFFDISISHKKVLHSFHAEWKRVYFNTICLSCLARKPENSLTCGHWFCSPCIMIHAASTVESPWIFSVNTCPLCRKRNQKQHIVKPYTAGVRCLTINGGNVSDLEVLGYLQQKLSLPLPFRSYFDMINATGLGKNNSWIL
jgi:hypothetical protein